MHCPRCQHENPAQAKFCEACATPLAARCTNCRTELRAGAKFCPQCAQPTDAATPRPATAGAPGQYTPAHLAEKILESRTLLAGERKQVTVLFADVKGSMELLAERDPEEARALLDPVLERTMEAVHRYEETVNQVMGDGIMALFGAPLAHEDHAVRACYAALRMLDSVSRYGDEMQRLHGAPIQLRVGMNSGEVVVRAIGNDLNMDYSAIGQTTHLAARMEQMAKPGTALISADTLRLAEGYVQVKPLGAMSVKGLAMPVEVFELTGAAAARTRLQAGALRGLTSFVGRQRELDVLAQALQDAAHGRGQAVAIVGEPGVGKSRLFWEFTRSHRTHGWLVVEAGSVSYGKATPYLPVIELLKNYFKIGEHEQARAVQEKITGKLLTLNRALESALAPLLALLDQPVDDTPWQRLDPRQRRRHTLEALKRMWLCEAQKQPLILVFEDLHWIDSQTQEFLDALLESVPAARILLLFNYRPEYRQPWGGRTCYAQLRLDPLATETAEALLAGLLGDEQKLQPLKSMLLSRTEGNPLFLEESVRALAETGVLQGERGAYRLVRPASGTEVPATVQALLAARVDRLEARDKQLLQSAAVIGKDVPFTLLQAIAGRSEGELRSALSRLQAAEFFYETSLFPDLEYSFKHALTHDVAYSSLLQERKRELHANVMRAIEQLHSERLAEHAERLAHHAQRGQQWESGARYSRQAGQRAATRSASRDAVAFLEQALDALARLPDGAQRTREEIDIRLELRSALTAIGEMSRALDATREALRQAREAGDRYRTARALAYLTFAWWSSREYGPAQAAGEEALRIAEEDGYADVVIIGRHYLSYVLWWRADFARAAELCAANCGALHGDAELERFGMPALASVYAHAELGVLLAEQGEFAEAEREAGIAVEIAARAQHPYSEVFAGYLLAQVYERGGRYEQAIRCGQETLARCDQPDVRLHQPWAKLWLGRAYAEAGQAQEAQDLLRDALALFDTLGVHVARIIAMCGLARAQLAAGNPEAAASLAAEALTSARDKGERTFELWALRALADAQAADKPASRASAFECYAQALALAERVGARPHVAHCHLGLGRLHAGSGATQPAGLHLRQALTLYREMQMQHWIEQAESMLNALPAA
jgi:class 3 adenylate cyclase/tetratricopeptide (TPR) repeat protein